MTDFEDIIEAERRNYMHGRRMAADKSKLWIYDNYYMNTKEPAYYFRFEEKMIQPEAVISGRIYDVDFEKGLINIETHVNKSSHTGNMVHYVMVELMSYLFKKFIIKIDLNIAIVHTVRVN